uniref:RING-type domain-containing protein n=1 Tax=Timema cristinae TaxID=61476 RepID=A0A7R9CP44_TIMCR|nr:unnamed protein product [Timema cristinae]
MPTLHEPHSLSTSQDEDEYHSISAVSTRSLELLPAQITYSSQCVTLTLEILLEPSAVFEVFSLTYLTVEKHLLLLFLLFFERFPDLSLLFPLSFVEFLLEENRRLKDARQCKICMDKDATVVFLPCAHLITCTTCAPSLNNCPMCRKNIRGTVRTFLD